MESVQDTPAEKILKDSKEKDTAGDNGWLHTGWIQLGKGTAHPDGSNKQHLSYFGGNGWLVESKVFNSNNKQYIADAKGWAKEVTTDYDRTLVRAFQLVEKVTNESMTKEQKLRASYNHIRDSYPEVRPRTPHYNGEGWHILYANDIFIDKKGNCFSTAAALAFMAKAIGYDKVYAISVNGHGWAEINGLVYDPERERHHKGSYYALSYNTPIGTQDLLEQYQWIFNSKLYGQKVKI